MYGSLRIVCLFHFRFSSPRTNGQRNLSSKKNTVMMTMKKQMIVMKITVKVSHLSSLVSRETGMVIGEANKITLIILGVEVVLVDQGCTITTTTLHHLQCTHQHPGLQVTWGQMFKWCLAMEGRVLLTMECMLDLHHILPMQLFPVEAKTPTLLLWQGIWRGLKMPKLWLQLPINKTFTIDLHRSLLILEAEVFHPLVLVSMVIEGDLVMEAEGMVVTMGTAMQVDTTSGGDQIYSNLI